MKIHMTQNASNLKAVKEPAEKTIPDMIKSDPKVFKTALISAAEEELSALKDAYVKKSADKH